MSTFPFLTEIPERIFLLCYISELNFRILCSVYTALQLIYRTSQKNLDTFPTIEEIAYTWYLNMLCVSHFLKPFFTLFY